MRATLTFLFIFLAFSADRLTAQPGEKDQALSSLLRLELSSGTPCGSGLLLEGGIILTASHVADSICPLDDCSMVRAFSAIDTEAAPLELKSLKPGSLSIYRRFPALDLALLKTEAKSLPFASISSVAPIQGEQVFAAGFPGCRNLSLTSGEILGVNAARLETNARGQRGSSGGVIFNSSFKAVGVIVEAKSLAQAIDSLFTGSYFALRATRIDFLEQLLGQSQTSAIGSQARLLRETYFSETAKASDLDRISAQAAFVSGAQELSRSIRDSATDPEFQALPGLLSARPQALLEIAPPAAPHPDYYDTELLFALAALEANALEISILEAPRPEVMKQSLIKSGRPPEVAQSYSREAAMILSGSTYGLNRYLLSALRPAILVLAALVLFWAWSLGFVFSSSRGSFLRRILIMIVIGAVFWPLSLVLYLVVRKRRTLTAVGMLLVLALPLFSVRAEEEKEIRRIAFGSCLRQDLPQPVWQSIEKVAPDLLLLLGDNIYAAGGDLKRIRQAYQKLASQPGLKKLRGKGTPVLATWDDNDYGMADGGADYPLRFESKKLFLEFFPILQDPRPSRGGVFFSRTLGPAGRRLQIVILDTRFFRSPLITGPQHHGTSDTQYLPNQNNSATLLGQEQWGWLSEQLDTPADFTLLVSSIQVLPTEHGGEKWANFPLERSRLFQLINEKQRQRVMILSGDRHYSEISRLDGVLPYPLYDFTSSSMTMDYPGKTVPNALRIGPAIEKASFGLLDIDWSAPAPAVTLSMQGAAHAQALFNTSVKLKKLAAKTPGSF